MEHNFNNEHCIFQENYATNLLGNDLSYSRHISKNRFKSK